MANIGTTLFTWLHGTHRGTDEFGNRYYEAKKANAVGLYRRWVIYDGAPEASKIPPAWHGWMHYSSDAVPNSDTALRYSWLKPHRANPTGTAKRYLPGGHLLAKGERQSTMNADYTPWQPK